MSIKKATRILIALLLLTCVVLVLYVKSFKDVERVCADKKQTEIYLLNYVTKSNLKHIVYEHNKNFKLESDEISRVYLLSPILKIPDPIFGDEYTYKPDGCDQIDNMDIYCEVRYSKMKNGKTDVWYNFME
ncbi:hypothetical protein HUK80_13735 [Flavobacterium sp. MAH-1]|uniref:Uncharacterized protein n=1 Tax=Flavobacterium agri TaxID=2743471 RepID=A0A7Y8Y3M0_9FLAO|nr:hypothetical protein [Flavobacterium agri]NUY81960.1 hypothetical protein [Flavobacterium agri]NYA71984.1 hypothetical protein [Flavobacterium agri]